MSDALAAALRSFFQPRILRLVWLPLVAAALLWAVAGFILWSRAVATLHGFLGSNPLTLWLGVDPAGWLAQWLLGLVMIGLLWPLTHATALFITAIIAMPLMTREVAARDYPQLPEGRPVSFSSSFWNALWSTLAYLLLWLLTLPLWLLALPALVLPVLINGWYYDRLFRYDALAGHASPDEFAVLTHRHRGSWFGLGILAALLQMVPFLNLLSPVYSGLTFIHFGFASLLRRRAGQPSAPAEITRDPA